MPTTNLRKISKVQPMREGEIDLLDYINGDLTNYLKEETQERTDEDTNLQNELDAEIQRATKAEETLQDNLDAETERATQAEHALNVRVDNEIKRATAAEQKLTTDLNSEVTRATAAEEKLTTDLANEVTRATQSETTLTEHIESETDRATKAETELSNKITAETKRATDAESGIEEHLQTAESEINAKIEGLGGNGLAYDSSTSKLNVKQADAQTFGGVKLKHDVDNDTSDEWAVTSDGVYKYAPSKAETTNQPTDTEFTNVLSGVTLTVMNATRIGGLMAMGIRIVTDASTTVSAATRIANTPSGLFKGIANAISNDGSTVMQIDAVGISCNKSIEPSKTLYFQIIGFYNG